MPRNFSPCFGCIILSLLGFIVSFSSFFRKLIVCVLVSSNFLRLFPNIMKSSPYRKYAFAFNWCFMNLSSSFRYMFAKIWLVRLPIGMPIFSPGTVVKLWIISLSKFKVVLSLIRNDKILIRIS